MKAKMITLEIVSEEASWLGNFLVETFFWVRPVISVLSTLIVPRLSIRFRIVISNKRNDIHIRRKHNTTREYIFKGIVKMDHIGFDDNLSDSLMKGLSR